MPHEARRVTILGPAREAERVARTSYGKLLAILASRNGDIAGCEDALGSAFAAALDQWPRTGVPDNPAAWLLTVARRAAGHARARQHTATAASDAVTLLLEERGDTLENPFAERRLQLLFVCAHPAIAPEMQAPLMLQTVLGIDGARIASAFLVSPEAMSQRLVRAKRKIRESGIAFELPDLGDAPARLAGVLTAIYGAFGLAWEDLPGAGSTLGGLGEEAIWLARLLVELLPDAPEALGLLSLMLYCEARRPARRDEAGAFVPLHRQDMARWSAPLIEEAEALLRRAAAMGAPGRFQTEAAIQSLHNHQRLMDISLRVPLAALYDQLAQQAPTAGVLVARAVAHAEAGEAAAALAMLDCLEGIATYQPWWAARARVCWLLGDQGEARRAAKTAAGLAEDPTIRAFLLADGFAY